MEKEEEGAARKMSREPQAETDLSMEPGEDKSWQQNLMEQGILSGSTAQESSKEEKPRTCRTRTGCKRKSRASDEERSTLARGGGGISELEAPEQPQGEEKPHKCSKCGKSFRWRSELIHH
ncbi:zinc finger protein 568-like [Prinia subflava]|uniref:zinc finger protein 568-like n=1 Tax=Prinia subflava TaxID=208062 RepID=UPI002FE20A23